MRDRARLKRAAAAIVPIAAAVVCLPPGQARAGSVVLWACHGPGGDGLGAAPFVPSATGDGVTSAYGLGCEGTSGTGGLSATLSGPDPVGGSSAAWRLPVPEGVTLRSVRIARATSGFGGAPLAGDPQWYEARTSSATLESSSLEDGSPALSGERSFDPAGGDYVSLGVGCGPGVCAGPPTVGVEISSIALGVEDAGPPTGHVTPAQSPVAGGVTQHLELEATDGGLGLASAEVSLDERTVEVVRLGGPSCPERPSGSATIDLAYGEGCPHSVAGIPLTVDTGPPGSHRLRVSVTDAAGNTATLLDQTIEVEDPPPSPGSDAIVLGVGGQGPSPGNGNGNGNGGGGRNGKGNGRGGVRGSSSSSSSSSGAGACRSPLLTMRLTSKPLRWVKRRKRRIPVLRARRDYVYRGRLTCLPAGSKHRVSAPTGTVVHVLYEIGRHPPRRSGRGTMTVHRGNLRAILGYSYTGSRTLVFRCTGAGARVQVEIPIEIARKQARRRRRAR